MMGWMKLNSFFGIEVVIYSLNILKINITNKLHYGLIFMFFSIKKKRNKKLKNTPSLPVPYTLFRLLITI